MKDLRHIKKFNESDENLNISDVNKSPFNIFTKNKWETVFSGDVKSKSGDGKLMLQVERNKNKYRVLAYSGGVDIEISLTQLIKTFPEVVDILDRENIKW